jgi:class 3 adenylate cyclase
VARQRAILRPFWRSCAIGMVVSVLMVSLYVADPMDQVSKFESLSLDLRFKYANRRLKPSDDIRIVAIDDQAIAQIEPEFGRWPWPRRIFADMIDVLHEAGAAQIALDLHFPEAQRVIQLPGASPETQEPPVQDDLRFAEAMAQAGNVYLPLVFPDTVAGRYDLDRSRRIGRQLAQDDIALPDAQYSRQVGLPVSLLGTDASLCSRMAGLLSERFWLDDQQLATDLHVERQAVSTYVGTVRRQVALERVQQQLTADPNAGIDAICQAFARKAPAATQVNPAEITWALEQARTEKIVQPRLPALPPGASTTDLAALVQVANPLRVQLPIAPLAKAAHGLGHVVFERDPDGAVRRLPMLIRWNDRIVPQMSLRVASDLLHLRWDETTVRDGKISIPGQARDGHSAVYTLFLDGDGKTLVNWAMPGKTWKSCFSPVPAGAVIEVAALRRTLRKNQEELDLALLDLVQTIQPSELPQYQALRQQREELVRLRRGPASAPRYRPGRSLEDDLERIRLGEQKIEMACLDLLRLNRQEMPATIEECTDPGTRKYLLLYRDLVEGDLARRIARTKDNLSARIDQQLAQLRKELAGKTVFVGCTATALDDIVSTPIWGESPGVMTHAQMLNAILANRSIEPVDEAANAGIVLACCIGMTVVASWLGPRSSLGTMIVACGTFTVLTMYVLFERVGIATALSAPVAGMFVTWAMITAYRQLVEERGRRLMTHTLQQYTSPALARRMAEDPGAVSKAEAREVTYFFSDLRGFTTISERLGAEATQKVLNLYLESMTEVLDRSQALINKFLGDGIFAFFNPAINPQADHAQRACQAALDAMAALEHLKAQPQGATCQALHMRIGLASGTAIVGNCGSERKFDYTCIGDTVNLASRLEGANKAFGTGILINGRCHDLLADRLMCRYVGRVIVAGRTAWEDTYELLGRRDGMAVATLDQVARFEQAVRCFIAGNVQGARADFQECLRQDAGNEAAKFYIEACEKQLQTARRDEWTGAVEILGK